MAAGMIQGFSTIPLVFQKLGFCQNQRSRFSPLEAVSYPRDRSDAEGIKDRDADEGKNQLLKHEGYKLRTPLGSRTYKNWGADVLSFALTPWGMSRFDLSRRNQTLAGSAMGLSQLAAMNIPDPSFRGDTARLPTDIKDLSEDEKYISSVQLFLLISKLKRTRSRGGVTKIFDRVECGPYGTRRNNRLEKTILSAA